MGPGAGLGAMPPPGAMGAPPGPPPGPPPGQPPIGMARGGYVQRFEEGSDEEGVTPLNERTQRMPSEASSEAAARILDPETKAAMREQYLNLIAPAGPSAPLPSLEAAMQRRIPEYQKLIGDRKEATQAQVLFDLAQRAFGYGANVDERGRPLRGNQAARLMAAFRGVPGTLGALAAQTEKTDQSVRLAALQAAEKDIAATQAQQARSEEARRSALLAGVRAGMLAESQEDRDRRLIAERERLLTLKTDAQQLQTEYEATVRERIAAENRASRERSEDARREAARLLNTENNLSKQLVASGRNIAMLEIGDRRNVTAQSIQEARDSAAGARQQLELATKERMQAEALASRERTAENIQNLITARQRETIAATNERAALQRSNAFDIAAMRAGTSTTAQAFRGNWFMPIVTDPALARAFAEGATDDATNERIRAAMIEYTKPQQVGERVDELGNRTVVTNMRPVPPSWTRAFEARRESIPTFQQTMSTSGPAPTVVPGGPPVPGMPTGAAAQGPVTTTQAAVPIPGAAEAGAAGQPAQQAQPAFPSIVSMAPPAPTRKSLWDSAPAMTGPTNTVLAAASKIPGLGFLAGDEAERKQGMMLTESLIEASLKNSRAPVDEQRRLRALLDVGPTISDVNKYRTDILAVSNTLYAEYRAALEAANSPSSTRDMRNEARKKAQATSSLLERIGPPVYDDASLDRVVGANEQGVPIRLRDTLQPGTDFFYLNPRTSRLVPAQVPRR